MRTSSRPAPGGGGLREESVRRTVLPGGLRVLSEQVPGVRSVAFGIWVAVGSRDERPTTAGSSHFLEHLLFKGTRRRDALAISAALDAVGGELNAFTAQEYTCYHARVLDRDLPLAVDVVTDMVTSSLLREADVEAERGVILEEIAMHEDEPGESVHDTFATAVYGDAPLGRPVLGTVETIEAVSRSSIAGFYRRRYLPSAMVVAAAGAIEHEVLLQLVRDAFGPLLTGDVDPLPRRSVTNRPPAAPARRIVVEARPTEQAHVVLGSTGLSYSDPRRFALGVLSTALGGGMSSRLFQEIREKRGLAYSVYTSSSSYAETGLFGTYAGCAPAKVRDVLSVCREVTADVCDHGLTDEEIARAKGAMRGSLALGLEDTGSRMNRLGKSELVHPQLLSVEEVLARIDAVTPDDVQEIAADILTRPLALGGLGKMNVPEIEKVLA